MKYILGNLWLAPLFMAFVACGGGSYETSTKSITDAVVLGKKCEALCRSDAGCSPGQAATCFEAMDCNLGSVLHRNGAPDLMDGGASCEP